MRRLLQGEQNPSRNVRRSLRAAYLAEEHPGAGAGFFLQLENKSHASITLPDPMPLSVHWYAATGGRWLWRSSSGSGGALVDALREKGPLFATGSGASSSQAPAWRTISPGQVYSWESFAGADPAMRYRPGCEHCNYPGEEQYRAVLAYAYLPDSPAGVPGALLRCGLRSNPVVMPPLADSQKAHNSGER